MSTALIEKKTDIVRPGLEPAAEAQDAESAIHQYMREISRVSLLSGAEEQELAREIEQGDRAESALANAIEEVEATVLSGAVRQGQRARDRLAASNLRLVVSIACRYQGRGLTLADLIQEGNLGLLRAIDKFDYRVGTKFSTYATWWIRQAILRGLADHGRTVRLPVHVVESIGRTLRIRQQLQGDLGREPSCGEVAEALGVAQAQVERDLKALPIPLSLDCPVDEQSDFTIADGLSDEHSQDPVTFAVQTDTADWLRCALRLLTKAQSEVLEWRYGLRDGVPRTLDEIATMRGVSRERVRQLEMEGLKALRSRLSRVEAPL